MDDDSFKINFNINDTEVIGYGSQLYCLVKEDKGESGLDKTLYRLEEGTWQKVLKSSINTSAENTSVLRLGSASNAATLLVHNSRDGVEKLPLGNLLTGAINGSVSEYTYNAYDLCTSQSDYIWSPSSGRREETSTWTYDESGYGNLTESNLPIVGKTTYTYYDASKYHQLDTQVQYAGTANAHTTKYELTADGLNAEKITENYKNNRQIVTAHVYDDVHKGNVISTTIVDKNNGVEKNLGTTYYTYTDQDGNHNRFPSRVSQTAETNDENFAMASREISSWYTYTPDGQIKTETDGLNRTKTKEYYRNGILKSETAADGTRVSYAYALRNISEEISGAEAAEENKVITTTENILTEDPAYVVEETYDVFGRLSRQEEKKGMDTVILAQYAYDRLGRPISIWDALENETKYAYDWKGRVTEVTYPEIKNDTLEMPETEGTESKVRVAYNDARLTQTVTDPAGVKTQAEFDMLERVVRESVLSERGEDGGYVLRENPISTIYTYDYMGNNTSIESGREESRTGEVVTEGRKNEYTYNDLGQLLNVKNELGENTGYGYDQWGNVNEMSSAGGSKTYMEYDGFGRLLWKSQPTNKERGMLTETEKQQYAYNAVGNLVKYKDQKGQIGSISYKENTDYIEEQKVGEITASFSYNGFGSVTAMTDSTGITSYSYDYKNRLETLTLPDGKSLFYKYDDMGNVDYVTDYFGTRHDYTYNAQNLLSRVSTGKQTVNYGYNADGTLRQKEQTGSVYTAYSYDENKNLVSMINQVKASSAGGTYEYTKYSYQYNQYGEQTEKKEEYKRGSQALETRITGYAYDELGRLNKETAEERTTEYSYDANGNRISATVEHTDTGDKVETALGSIDNILKHSINYSYDQANRLQKVTESIESGESGTSTYEGLLEIAEEYQYDANGNIKSKAKSYMLSSSIGEEEEYAVGTDQNLNSYVYTYDEKNQLKNVSRGDGEYAEYQYDGTGARVGKTVGMTETGEIETIKYYLMGEQVLNETSSREGETTNLIGMGIEGRLNISSGGEESAYFMQKNGHGDVTAVMSGTGRAASYDYDAFGNTRKEEGGISNPIRYAGEYLDEETGLIYLRARYYDPATGRFVSEDTHWTPENMIYGDEPDENNPQPSLSSILQSINLYAYCGSDPINRFDITGNEWGAIRDFAASLADIYGSDYEFYFNEYSTRLTMGGGYTRKEGTFWYDGDVYMQDTGMFEGKAQNIDGRMYMQRTDFYRAMGIDYDVGQISFTVTPEGNAISSFVSGLVIGAMFKGDVLSGVIGGLLDYIYSRDAGDYWIRTTTAYQYDPMGDWYDTITTYEVYYKHPSYSEYTTEPIDIITWYSRVEELY